MTGAFSGAHGAALRPGQRLRELLAREGCSAAGLGRANGALREDYASHGDGRRICWDQYHLR